jgi:hypothetical protein
MPMTDDEIRAILQGCEGGTPGKWIGSPVISSMAGLPVVASSGRLICDMNHVRHSKIDQFVEGDKAFNSESIRNAAHIARCDPTTIAELCTRLLDAEDEAAQYKSSLIAQHQAHVATMARLKVLEEAGTSILDFYNGPLEAKRPDVFQRLMVRLAAALQEKSK